MTKRLGLIAGNRQFPIHIAKAAKARGYEVVAVGLREETDPALEQETDRMHWVALDQIGQLPEIFKEEGITDLILAGQIRPERLLAQAERFDTVVRGLMKKMPDRSGNSAMKMAVRYLETRGFRILNSGLFLKDWIPDRPGELTQRAPSAQERADLAHGLKLARALATYDVGQTVVIRKKAVVALEAMEGTDAVIRRAGELAGPGVVVVKAAGPRHDMRFDIPAIGFSTLSAMVQAQAVCLGVESKRTLLFDRPQLLEEANRKKMAWVAL